MTEPLTYADYYNQSAYGCYVRASRWAGEPPVSFTEVEQPAGSFPDPPLPFVAIGVFRHANAALTGDLGAGKFSGRVRRGAIIVAPLNAPTNMALDAPHSILIVGLPAARVRALMPEWPVSGLDFGTLHSSVLYDRFIEDLCLRLFQETESGRSSQLLVDGAVMTLLACLQQHVHGSASFSSDSPVIHASQWRIRRAAEYLRAHLDATTGLAELADVAGISPFHFARQFKKVFGVSPHRYHLRCRVEEAQRLLVATRMPVTTIALDLGFCSAEHFSSTFHRHTGSSPKNYRAEFIAKKRPS